MYEMQMEVSERPERLSGLFRQIQDLSGRDAALWHASVPELAEKGLIWVVVRYDIRLLSPLTAGMLLRGKTWAAPFRHRMSQRYYMAYSSDGTCVLQGCGIWAVVDSSSRMMADPVERGVAIVGEVTGVELPRPTSPERLCLSDSVKFPVTENLLDDNRHMNNTFYFDAVQDCIMQDTIGLTPARIRVVYENEALAGELLNISWGRKGNTWYFEGQKNQRPCFQMGLEYQP